MKGTHSKQIRVLAGSAVPIGDIPEAARAVAQGLAPLKARRARPAWYDASKSTDGACHSCLAEGKALCFTSHPLEEKMRRTSSTCR